MKNHIEKILIPFIIILVLITGQCGKKQSTESPQPTTGTITGTVRSTEDQSLLENAQIRAVPGEYIGISDSAGIYTIPDCPEGEYLLIASKEAFENDSADVLVTAGHTTNTDFYLTPEFNPLIWEYITDKPIYYSVPAIDNEGTIYVGTGVYLGTTSGSLYAIHPDGSLKWKQDLENNVFSPVIGADGTIYVMDTGNALYAFDNTGALQWRYENWIDADFTEVGQRCVAIGPDQTLYVYVAFDLYAINPDGSLLWVFDPRVGGTPCGASPVVGKDSTIYIIPGGEILYALRSNGTLKWQFYLEAYDAHSYTSPSLDSEDVIYFGVENGDGGYVYAVYPDGTLKWRVLAGRDRAVRASPVIDEDGTVYTATKAYSHNRPAEVIAISPEGKIEWRFTVESVHFTPDDVYATPTIGADGLIYMAAETGFVYALNRDGTLNWTFDSHGGINWSSPTMIEDGTLYIGAMKNEGGALLALKTESMGLADTPWPTFRQNNQNNGRSSKY
ncbi:PQQ-binding-like beta-propeller repeat protein [bacterium]|nr:PQQ-binding-like beta-propeller repeat protein [bacterium]